MRIEIKDKNNKPTKNNKHAIADGVLMFDFTLLQMRSNWKLFSMFECRRSS